MELWKTGTLKSDYNHCSIIPPFRGSCIEHPMLPIDIDGFAHVSKWCWDKDEFLYKADYQEPAIGRSLIMSPFNDYFTWQTTDVIEIVEERDNYIKFKTQNSNYELWKLNVND